MQIVEKLIHIIAMAIADYLSVYQDMPKTAKNSVFTQLTTLFDCDFLAARLLYRTEKVMSSLTLETTHLYAGRDLDPPAGRRISVGVAHIDGRQADIEHALRASE
ncbi:hypothetical protein [Brenneria corticis]|uniref:Uncharacterized protein n=1 Tax=Brenneria corticis TaxID=2173106 RepID=A0A2U1U302_9GAMM|nr:hypothetical protein [Brenneria sp. CFCC 11842]PWC16046.1 hypothetical protein DDT56_11085 [Brenneria sp. CFCC 11842]